VTIKAYRGRHQIIAKMLNIINESESKGATRTSIMYKAFLSHAQLKEYLSFLLENGLIEGIPVKIKNHGNEKLIYKITQKGLRLLQLSHEMEILADLD
jgi:predicted transcriptional regulator